MDFKNMIQKRQDRLLAFFDAILAIAITVLALEIAIPEIGHLDSAGRYDFLVSLTCYLISFTAMATLWYIHTNFYSNHELTGSGTEVILHLVLLFVITLFQPITRAVGAYPQDIWVKLMYVGSYLLMSLLVLLIFVLTRRNGEKVQKKHESAKQLYRNAQENSKDKELDERDLILRIVYAVHNPEDLMQTAADRLPEEYVAMIEEQRVERRKSYRISLFSTMVMAASITIAVISLMFSVWCSYLVLAAGIVVLVIIRMAVWRSGES